MTIVFPLISLISFLNIFSVMSLITPIAAASLTLTALVFSASTPVPSLPIPICITVSYALWQACAMVPLFSASPTQNTLLTPTSFSSSASFVCGLTPIASTTRSAGILVCSPVALSSTMTPPFSILQSLVPVSILVPYGLILSISSSTSWNHAPGAISSAISTMVTLLPRSLRY